MRDYFVIAKFESHNLIGKTKIRLFLLIIFSIISLIRLMIILKTIGLDVWGGFYINSITLIL